MDRDQIRQARFGQVRSLLHEGSLKQPDAWREILFALLETEYAVDPLGYEQVWVPYLDGFHALWREPLLKVNSLEMLTHAAHVAPFACFDAKLGGYYGAEAFGELVASPFASQLSSLVYHAQSWFDYTAMSVAHGGLPLGLSVAQSVADAVHMRSLKRLTLNCQVLGDRGAALLAGSAHLVGLESLELRINRIGVSGAKALAGSSMLSGLQSLDVSTNALGDEGVEILLGALPRGANLRCRTNGLTEVGQRKLERFTAF